MGGLSFWHILLLAVVVLVLFGGRGRFSDVMGDFAKGIKNFKKGMADDETPPAAPPAPQVLPRSEQPVPPVHDQDKVAH
ncbi:MAG: twin-arginine translocase TatA/TatE family subunit [Rhizomicrobium sp.]